MKLAWILILISIMIIIKCSTAEFNDYLSESKTALIVKANKTTRLTERRSKISINKRKNFFVTLKPPTNTHRRKYRHIKKRKLTRKTQDKDNIKITLMSHICNNRKAIEEYIGNRKQIINTDKNNTKVSIDNTHSEIKNNVTIANRKAVKCITKCCKLKAVFKNHKCISKFKRLGRLLSSKSIRIINITGRSKSVDRILLDDASVSDSASESDSSRNELSLLCKEKYKSSASFKNDGVVAGNINGGSRLKRSVNIIEEEGTATTSSGFRFTSRDSSIHSDFIYRNIHN